MLILRILLFDFILLLNYLVYSEWVEIPQFSDDTKIYRVPFVKSDRPKIMLDSAFEDFKYELINFTDNNNNYRKFHESSTIQPATTTAIATVNHRIIKVIANYTENSKNRYDEQKDHFHDIPSDLQKNIQQPSCASNVSKITINGNVTSNKKSASSSKSDQNQRGGTLGFLNNLPLELFNRVHQTFLTIRKATVEAKMRFLENFKKTIMNKLKTRLSAIISPVRRKRGSGWDEHSSGHMGFPSLEGALLAISFLTFAVYLVQLVMTLMRNLAGSTTNASTVLVNRRKKSIEEINEDTARVYQFMDEFYEEY